MGSVRPSIVSLNQARTSQNEDFQNSQMSRIIGEHLAISMHSTIQGIGHPINLIHNSIDREWMNT